MVGLGVGLAAAARTQRERRAARARRFGLLAGEPAAWGLRRIALAQLDIAIGLLSEDSAGLAQEDAVHEARKAFKRLRALMRLLEDELGAAAAGRELEILRDAGRQLAGARDGEVLVTTLDEVLRRAPRKLARRRAVRELRAQLERERVAATQQMLQDTVTRARVVGALQEMRARVLAWRLSERSAIELAGPGLRRIYREGDRARRKARKQRAGKHNARAMHTWRKHAKELRYALEVLEEDDAKSTQRDKGQQPNKNKRNKNKRDKGRRVKGQRGKGKRDKGKPKGARQKTAEQAELKRKRIAVAAKRADALGEMLGEDHDLVVLSERVRAIESAPRRRRRERHAGPHTEHAGPHTGRVDGRARRRARKARRARKQLLREIARRRAKLRTRALRAGATLYEYKPARFVRRLAP